MTKSLRSEADFPHARPFKVAPSTVKNSSSTERIIIGKLGAPRGLNGEMKLIPLTDFADRFDGLEEVFIDDRLRRIDYIKAVGTGMVIRFDGVEDRNAAQLLTNKFLKVERSNAAPLNDGEFYTFDIIGLDVFDLDGQRLGTVDNVLKTGSNDVFVARSDDGREILIPALKAVVKRIDIEDGRLTIDPKMLEAI